MAKISCPSASRRTKGACRSRPLRPRQRRARAIICLTLGRAPLGNIPQVNMGGEHGSVRSAITLVKNHHPRRSGPWYVWPGRPGGRNVSRSGGPRISPSPLPARRNSLFAPAAGASRPGTRPRPPRYPPARRQSTNSIPGHPPPSFAGKPAAARSTRTAIWPYPVIIISLPVPSHGRTGKGNPGRTGPGRQSKAPTRSAAGPDVPPRPAAPDARPRPRRPWRPTRRHRRSSSRSLHRLP